MINKDNKDGPHPYGDFKGDPMVGICSKMVDLVQDPATKGFLFIVAREAETDNADQLSLDVEYLYKDYLQVESLLNFAISDLKSVPSIHRNG